MCEVACVTMIDSTVGFQTNWQKPVSREIEPNEAKEEWYRKAKNLLKNQSDSDEPQEYACIWRCLGKSALTQ